MQIFEHDELKTYLPPLDEANLKLLRADIKENGIREPLVLWNDYDTKRHWLIDGYHRKAIADELGKNYATRLEYFDGLDDAKEWIIINQCAKRNFGGIPPFYVAELVRIRTARETAKTKTEIVEETAKDLGVSERTVWRGLKPPVVKMGYENKMPERDEFDQSAPEYEDEYNQAMPDDIIEASGFDEFDQSTGFDEAEASQEPFAHRQGQAGQKRKRKFSHKKEALKQKKAALRAFVPVLGKCQTAYGNIEDYFEGLPTIPFQSLFEAVEELQVEMEKAEKKAKFGGKKL